jgi:hypothetical protein
MVGLVDQYGRPIQASTSTPGLGMVGDVLGGATFERLLGRGKEAAGRATEAATKAVKGAGGIKALGTRGLGLAGRYAPLVGGGLQLMQGDVLGAVGSTAGGMLGSVLGPVGAIAGATLGGPALKGIAGLAGGAAQAATGALREAGKSGLFGGGVEISDADVKRIEELSRVTGLSQVEVARQMLPIRQEFAEAEKQRLMQLNQQTAQLTGALNRQLYTAQLAGGAQQQAGETVRTMMTAANPYAQSAFQYRG